MNLRESSATTVAIAGHIFALLTFINAPLETKIWSTSSQQQASIPRFLYQVANIVSNDPQQAVHSHQDPAHISLRKSHLRRLTEAVSGSYTSGRLSLLAYVALQWACSILFPIMRLTKIGMYHTPSSCQCAVASGLDGLVSGYKTFTGQELVTARRYYSRRTSDSGAEASTVQVYDYIPDFLPHTIGTKDHHTRTQTALRSQPKSLPLDQCVALQHANTEEILACAVRSSPELSGLRPLAQTSR
jgi:hypothetical protein